MINLDKSIMNKTAILVIGLLIELSIVCFLFSTSAPAQDAGICPPSTMPGELEFPQDMLFDQEELDDDPSDGRIAPESCANITVLKGVSPYRWDSSDADNFSLDRDEDGATNQVCLSVNACGAAKIMVTDANGHQYTAWVLSLLGRWGDWSPWIGQDDPCAGEYYASYSIDVCGDHLHQYHAAFFGAQYSHDKCPTTWTICSEHCCATWHAFAGFARISAAFIRERQWVCGQ